jgi:hypothetical protein
MASRSNPFPMGVSDPLPAGYMIWFGSLEFRATGNSYLMELLSPRRNPDTPISPARRNRRSGQHSRPARVERHRAARLSSPMWVEVTMSQLSIAADGATASSSRATASPMPAPSSTAAPVPPSRGGGATAPSPFPFGMRNAATYVITSCRSATSSHRLLTTPTPRR